VTTRSSDVFALGVASLAENDDEIAKTHIDSFINIREQGSAYVGKMLIHLLEKDSDSFNLIMNSFLEACFVDGGSSLSGVVDECDYLEMLAMEQGLSKNGLLKKIQQVAKRKKLDFDGIDELPENELVVFIEENRIFKKSIPNPWFMDLTNIDWIFIPAIVLMNLAKHRGIDVEVEDSFAPLELLK
jgi:hypothetical protein